MEIIERKPDKTDIRNDDYQDIIDGQPNRVIRLGISVICFVFAWIVFGSFLFKYPDTIRASFVLTATNPSIEIRAKTDGKIVKVHVNDKQKVESGDVIAVIENSCRYEDYVKLKSDLEKWNRYRQDAQAFSEGFNLDCAYELGELQVYFSDLQVVVMEYKVFNASDEHDEKQKNYQNRIHMYKQYLRNLEEQNSLLKQDLDYSYKQLKRDSIIFENDYEPESYYDKSKSTVILKNKVIKEAINKMTLTGVQINELEAMVRESSQENRDERIRLESEMMRRFDVLKARMGEWEQTYLLVSPVDGLLAYTGFCYVNRYVSEGDIVFQIVHENPDEAEVFAEVPVSGAGKVKPGQDVRMDFYDFPEHQFGKVRGIVQSVSPIQNNGMYRVKIVLPDSLSTNYGLTLPFKYNMKGRAEIITDDIPLAARLINPIRRILYDGF